MPLAPTFDGNAIFGVAPMVIPKPNPHDIQITAYPGVNGLDFTRLGSRGGTVTARGLLVAPDLPSLSVIEGVWWTYLQTAFVSSFTDATGNVWPLAVVTDYMPAEEIKPYNDGANFWSRKYEATILLLA